MRGYFDQQVAGFCEWHEIPYIGPMNNGPGDCRGDQMEVELIHPMDRFLIQFGGDAYSPATLTFRGCADDPNDPARHQYDAVTCPRCGLVFCHACSGKGTNIHEGGKHAADILECPACGANAI